MHITRREFDRLVRQTFEELPRGIRNAMENVAILLEDRPSGDDLPTGEDLEDAGSDGRYTLFGLYTGVPLAERGGALPTLPDTIILFQRPIESVCTSKQEVIRQIRITLLHELGHYLGMTEQDLERLGYG